MFKFTFDWNEWFMFISSFIVFAFFLFIRKHFNQVTTIIVWVFTIVYVESLDYFIAGNPFELYYFGDNESYEITTTVIHLFLYPSFSMIFLYFYDKWNIRGGRLFLYLFAWTIISVFYEWICLKANVLTYTGWKLFYSIPTYPISSLVLIGLYHYVKRELATYRGQSLASTRESSNG